MKRCSYCGHENSDDALACSGCGETLETSPQPETDPELLDPGLSPVIVATFTTLQDASILQGRLVAAGIEATIPEEYEQTFSAVISLEKFTVRVARKDYDAAMAELAEGSAGQPPTAA